MVHSFLNRIHRKPVFGMVHVRALPGTPDATLTVSEICRIAFLEAQTLIHHGFDGILIENMHDRPYLNRNVGPEIVAAMTMVGQTIKSRLEVPCGIQILAGANEAALAVAQAAGLDFIRAEGFVFGHMADEGVMQADAGTLLRYRRRIGAEHVAIFTDIQKKHSAHAITADLAIGDHARAAEFFHSDGLIITGSVTGQAPDPTQITEVKHLTDLPVLLGSGIEAENLSRFWSLADGFIVGSTLKVAGHWFNELDEIRIAAFMAKVKALRDGGD